MNIAFELMKFEIGYNLTLINEYVKLAIAHLKATFASQHSLSGFSYINKLVVPVAPPELP